MECKAFPLRTKVIERVNETRFLFTEACSDAACEVTFRLHAPIADSYILLPACAYDGNRFEAVQRHYPPMFTEAEFGLDAPTRMTEVPRLRPDGDSFMDVTTGDLSVPCVCVLNKREKKAFLLFTNQGSKGLNHGITLEQTGDALTISLRAPAKRRLVYRWYDGVPSLRENPEADAPMAVKAGEEIVIAHNVFSCDCESIPALYRIFFEKRAELYHGAAHASLPFSAFWDLAVEEMNSTHFVEPENFYALDAQTKPDISPFSVWQAGWVGGGITTLPLMAHGDKETVHRAIQTLQFAARLQSKSGFYYGVYACGHVLHDCFGHHKEKHNFLLIRKQADMVYYMAKQLLALASMGMEVPGDVLQSARLGADALVKLWHRYGQLGQFVNAETGEICVGGSTSGALAPGALAAMYSLTGDVCYLDAAREIARFFYKTATQIGVTTGGPGEILSAPDSESAAALLESYITLYEMDGTAEWLEMAKDAAHQAASWVVPYDYEFPKDSRFGKMGIYATGSVWANVQNKHSAPGLCTLSTAAFLKLYRATGDGRYLRLMQEIAHFMPQAVSTPERPMYMVNGTPLRPGEMCERVNLSDWEGNENVGDSIFGPSSWPEASMMMNWLEVPGIYVSPSEKLVCVSDHVKAQLEGDTLMIENPTNYPARVKVLVDRDRAKPLGLYWQEKLQTVSVEAGGQTSILLSKYEE